MDKSGNSHRVCVETNTEYVWKLTQGMCGNSHRVCVETRIGYVCFHCNIIITCKILYVVIILYLWFVKIEILFFLSFLVCLGCLVLWNY